VITAVVEVARVRAADVAPRCTVRAAPPGFADRKYDHANDRGHEHEDHREDGDDENFHNSILRNLFDGMMTDSEKSLIAGCDSSSAATAAPAAATASSTAPAAASTTAAGCAAAG